MSGDIIPEPRCLRDHKLLGPFTAELDSQIFVLVYILAIIPSQTPFLFKTNIYKYVRLQVGFRYIRYQRSLDVELNFVSEKM